MAVRSLDNQLGRMLRWFSGYKKGVGGSHVENRGQARLNPGETCPPAYSGELVLCGGKTGLKGKNSSSICYVTFLIYFLTMASQIGCDFMNSEVAGSIFTVFPVKRKKGISRVQEPVKLTNFIAVMRALRSLQVTPIPKSRIGYWVSHRGS